MCVIVYVRTDTLYVFIVIQYLNAIRLCSINIYRPKTDFPYLY